MEFRIIKISVDVVLEVSANVYMTCVILGYKSVVEGTGTVVGSGGVVGGEQLFTYVLGQLYSLLLSV